MADETLRQPSIMRSSGTTFDAALMLRDNGLGTVTSTVVHGPVFVGRANAHLWVVVDIEALSGTSSFDVETLAELGGTARNVARKTSNQPTRLIIPINVDRDPLGATEEVVFSYVQIKSVAGGGTVAFSAHIATTPPDPS
jgi:hypothetical protein